MGPATAQAVAQRSRSLEPHTSSDTDPIEVSSPDSKEHPARSRWFAPSKSRATDQFFSDTRLPGLAGSDYASFTNSEVDIPGVRQLDRSFSRKRELDETKQRLIQAPKVTELVNEDENEFSIVDDQKIVAPGVS